ncbi:hypothetical protein ACFUIY_17280 [Streptomyces griseorubiginosus]|uniref:hypothetical protein n=1 Tax=Streptomyces griseorubiginosus TaxID=67304 RepID=UPI00362DA130
MSPDPVTAPPPYTAPPRRHDRAAHSWPLAPLPFGESRRNLHPTDPTDRGPIGPSAAVIHLLERLGRVYDVRRPTPTPVAARRA